MESFETTSLTLQPVLRMLLEQTQRAWCFLPLEDDVVEYCSREFLDLWRLPPADSPDDVAVLPGLELTSAAFIAAAESLGIEADWLHGVGSSRTAVVMTRNDGLTVRSVSSPVIDGSGRPIGRMISCEVVSNSQALEALVNRSLRARTRLDVLTPREIEVLQMVFDGFTNKAVAIRMNISDKTVEKHRANIMEKLGVRNVVELIRLVTEAGIADIRFQSPQLGA